MCQREVKQPLPLLFHCCSKAQYLSDKKNVYDFTSNIKNVFCHVLFLSCSAQDQGTFFCSTQALMLLQLQEGNSTVETASDFILTNDSTLRRWLGEEERDETVAAVKNNSLFIQENIHFATHSLASSFNR